MKKLPKILSTLYNLGIKKLEDPLIRGKLKNQIHCLENSESGIIFLKDSISIFTCPKPLKNSLVYFLHGGPRSQACLKYGVLEADLENLLQFLLQRLDSKSEQSEEPSQERILDRIVLNISNSCNLSCKYCYAGGGTYGGVQSYMDEKTALATIDRFLNLFDGIDKLQFFGGEPLLNPKLISFICEEFTQRRKKGEIRKLPQFSVVTNGTIVSEEVFKLLKKYNMKPTISMDGPKIVNDYLRGKGTTQKIEQFIRCLEKYNIGYSFECTFTGYHIKSGIYLNDLLDYFFENFKQNEVHIPPVALTRENSLFLSEERASKLYREGVEYSMENLKNGKSACLSFASRIMDVFVKGEPIKNYCPAGLYTLSVDTEGYLYPCFMFTGLKDFQLGNVFNEYFLQKDVVNKIFKRILMNDKANDPECLKCWASPFCSGCIGAEYFTNNGTFSKTSCDLTKAMVEGFLTKTPDLVSTLPQEESVDETGTVKECMKHIKSKTPRL
ncbi:MAG: radical SAM protein [Candidatus Hodarchaeota archaeon]